MASPDVPSRVPFLDLAAMTAELGPELHERIEDVITRSAFVGGPDVARFEQDWATYCGTTSAVGVANGTDALSLALRGLGIGPGDEVLVPANTFVATAEAVVDVGATPVFVDVRPDTLLIDLDDADGAVGPHSAAVIPVHLYGNAVDMDEVLTFASRHGLAVVEDAAQAHGATWEGRRVGSFGDAGCFSFYPGKNLGAFGDGGAVVTDDPELAARVRSLADHGRVPDGSQLHDVAGTNSRLDGLQAVVLSLKLDRLDGWNERRREVASWYRHELAGLPIELVAVGDAVEPVFHLHVVRVDDRDGVVDALGRAGIGVGIHYRHPCHRQPAFAPFADRPLLVAERAAAQILSLPMSPHLERAAVARVAAALGDALEAADQLARSA